MQQRRARRKRGLLCFDLDNTLIASNQCHLRAYQLAFKKQHVPQRIPNKKILQYFGEGSKKIVRRLFPRARASFIEQIVKGHDFFVRTHTWKQARIIPGARDVLQRLRRHWELALISNCNHGIITALLRAGHIPRRWFTIIIGQDQVKHPKPAPDELLKAEHIAHLRAAYFIGDSIYDVRAGKRAGVKVIAIPSGVHTARQLARERPYKLFVTLRALLQFLQ